MKTIKVIKANTRRKSNGWAPVVDLPSNSCEVLAARYATQEQAISHAQELVDAYIKSPNLLPECYMNRENICLEY